VIDSLSRQTKRRTNAGFFRQFALIGAYFINVAIKAIAIFFEIEFLNSTTRRIELYETTPIPILVYGSDYAVAFIV
jgi:hypothetical protein